MRRWYLFVGISVLLIGINVLFLYLDDEREKVDRISYVNDWTFVEQQDMYDKLHTEGVVNFSDEEDIYFDQDNGEFEEFLIEEGDEITSGDPVYSYKIRDYQETLVTFQSEEEELSDSITGIESAIDKMQAYHIPQKITEYTFIEELEESGEGNTKSLEVPDNAAEAELIKEQYITEKEKELAEKKAQHASVQTQIEELASGDDTVTVESPYGGKVTDLSKSLDNPIITIQPPDIHVEGELTEEERKQVQENMSVEIDVDGNHHDLEGLVSDVSDYPKNASIHDESVYPFNVSLADAEDEDGDTDNNDDAATDADTDTDKNDPADSGDEVDNDEADNNDDVNNAEDGMNVNGDNEDAEDDVDVNDDNEDAKGDLNADDNDEILAGYHTTLSIQLKESLDATTLERDLSQKDFVWEMNADSELHKQPIEKDIQMGNATEITEGLNPGEWVAAEPSEQFRSEATFITPLKWSELDYSGVFKSNQWEKGFLSGLLMR